jgi:hypothetical protein
VHGILPEPVLWMRCGRRRDGVDFELPYLSKFLLLAAYVASRNPPSADRPLFDPTVGKRRRHGHLAHDKQVSYRAIWRAHRCKQARPHVWVSDDPASMLLDLFCPASRR